MNFIIYFWFVWLDFFFVFGWMGLKFNPAEWSRMCVCVCVCAAEWMAGLGRDENMHPIR